MTVEEAKKVICWRDPCKGWPLDGVLERRPLVFDRLARAVKRTDVDEFSRALRLLRNLPSTVDRVKKAKEAAAAEKRIKKKANRAFDAWLWR